MTEPQVWAIIGVLAAAFAGTITVTTQLMMKTFSAQVEGIGHQISGLKTEMVLRFEQVDERMDARFERVDERMDRFEQRMDRLEKRVDGIDTDVQTLTRRVMPE